MVSFLKYKKFSETVKKSYAKHPKKWIEKGCSEPSSYVKWYLGWTPEKHLELLEFMLLKKRNTERTEEEIKSDWNKICEFIKNNFSKQETINTKVPISFIKSLIWLKIPGFYITNDDLIASMVIEGYVYRKDIKNSNDVYFNVE